MKMIGVLSSLVVACMILSSCVVEPVGGPGYYGGGPRYCRWHPC